jgi:outer membrane protein, heavy metal efflux system
MGPRGFMLSPARHSLIQLGLALGLATLVGSQFATADTAKPLALGFQQALALALHQTPSIKMRQAQLSAAEQAAIAAAALPDPKLSLGINNMPVQGENRFSSSADFMTMRQIGVMQEFPNRAKRRARQAEADSNINAAELQIQLTARKLLAATAASWIDLRSLQQQLQLLNELDKENRLLSKTHEASHTGRQSMLMDTLIPEEETALLAERRDQLLRKQSRARAQLQRWLGATPVQSLSGRAPEWQLDLTTMEAQLESNPELLLYQPLGRMLDAQIAQARAAKRPDWALETMYGARGYPAEDMISVKLTIDLPVFSRSRQNPRIAASLAERDALNSEREQIQRRLRAELTSDYADYRQLQRAYQRQRDTFVPLADKKIALIQAAWQSNGGMGLTDVIHARQARLEAKLKLLELGAKRDSAAARLYFRYGITRADINQLQQFSANSATGVTAPAGADYE